MYTLIPKNSEILGTDDQFLSRPGEGDHRGRPGYSGSRSVGLREHYAHVDGDPPVATSTNRRARDLLLSRAVAAAATSTTLEEVAVVAAPQAATLESDHPH